MSTKFATGTSPSYPSGYTDTALLADNSPGDHSTYVPPAPASDVWVVVDLLAVMTFDRIEGAFYASGSGSYTIQVSPDLVSWVDVVSGSSISAGWVTYDSGTLLVPYTTMQYIRVHVSDTGGLGGSGP